MRISDWSSDVCSSDLEGGGSWITFIHGFLNYMHWIHLAPRPSLCAPPLPARHHARRCRPVCAPSPPPALVDALARIGTGGGGRGDGDPGPPASRPAGADRKSVVEGKGGSERVRH